MVGGPQNQNVRLRWKLKLSLLQSQNTGRYRNFLLIDRLFKGSGKEVVLLLVRGLQNQNVRLVENSNFVCYNHYTPVP